MSRGTYEVEVNRALQGSRESVETLLTDFLAALEEGDEEQIVGLTLSREEFDRVVWPQLPASRPGTNLSPSFVWESHQMRSLSGLGSILRRYGGQSLQLVKVHFREGSTDYSTFVVHRDAFLEVTDATGGVRQLKLFGSVLELDGEFKIFSFVL